MTVTVQYNKMDYVQKLRERIATPTTWTDVMNVKYSDTRKIVNSYMSTEPTAQSYSQYGQYTHQNWALTADTLTISTNYVLPMLIDEADRYQQSYVDQMKLADFQGKKISEQVESLTLAQHSNWTDFGQTDLDNTGDDDTTQITVSASTVDDIIRAIKRKLYANDGVDLAVERGIFIVWRAEDFELLEAFVQANGFTEADISLKNGIPVQKAFRYMGVDHYLSNSHTANHVFAGIKKTGELGLLKGTWGQVKMIEDQDKYSGLTVVSRFDYGYNWPGQLAEFFMDVNVA